MDIFESNLFKNFTTIPTVMSWVSEIPDINILMDGTTPINTTMTKELPIDMKFNDGHLLSIIVYSVLFLVGACGNIRFISTIQRYKYHSRLNRINLFLLNLAIADLLVTFLLMPLEISWAVTVSWKAGDLACRILSFFRTFGLYLSGFVLICISLDCYFAVLKPLSLTTANRRGKIMLITAWIASGICSLPQSFIFHVEKHPDFPWYEQCVTFNSFSSYKAEMAYNIFGFVGMYALPLGMILFSYGSILCEVTKVLQVHQDGKSIRISNIKRMSRAKVRTLKLTLVIVLTFSLCWTPYNIMSLWYWIDKESAYNVDQKIQKGFFLFAVTNSCLNPLVYGYFNKRKSNESPNVGNEFHLCENNNNIGRGGGLPHQGNHPRTKEHQRISTGPDFKILVRWKPRPDCICKAVPSTSSSSGAGAVVGGIGPNNEIQSPTKQSPKNTKQLYQANGIPFYLNKNFHNSLPIISSGNSQSNLKTSTPSKPRSKHVTFLKDSELVEKDKRKQEKLKNKSSSKKKVPVNATIVQVEIELNRTPSSFHKQKHKYSPSSSRTVATGCFDNELKTYSSCI